MDPVDPETVAAAVKEHNVNLTRIFTTHHHWDHAGGNEKVTKEFKELQVYGGDDRIEAMTHKVKHREKITMGDLTVTCLETPCHTSGHICYYVTGLEKDTPLVFTGIFFIYFKRSSFIQICENRLFHSS